MEITQTKLPGVILLKPKVFQDDRGFFLESYNRLTLAKQGIEHNFVQDNHSLSKQKGTLRGLHFQKDPMAQTKLVRVVRGAIFDVAVDIRKDSPHFGKWVGMELSDKNHHQLLVPKGFAHGFCTLQDNTEVLYKVDVYYSPEHDAGYIWNDPTFNIDWPVADPMLSEKDKNLLPNQSL